MNGREIKKNLTSMVISLCTTSESDEVRGGRGGEQERRESRCRSARVSTHEERRKQKNTYAVRIPVSSPAFTTALAAPVASSNRTVVAGRPGTFVDGLGTATILIEVADT